MYNVIKRIGQSFIDGEIIGSFETFDEALKAAQEKVCKDLFHEGSENAYYWLSDENDPDTAYKVRIDKV